jgi:hypothetical protein
MLFKPGVRITNSGAVVDQADQNFEYTVELFRKPGLSKMVRRLSMNRHIIELTNGSRLKVITASKEGFNGPHPHKSNIDEVDLIDWPVLEEGFSMPQSGPYKGQDRLASTRKSMSGTMSMLLDESENLGMKIYKWSIFEVVEKCTLDCKTCDIFANKCQGRAKQSNGYYPVADMINKTKRLSTRAWKLQWGCEDDLVEGMFYEDLRKDVHFKSREWFVKRYKIPDDGRPIEQLLRQYYPTNNRIQTLDFGWRDPNVFQNWIEMPDGVWVVYKLFYEARLKPSDVAKCYFGLLGTAKNPAFNWAEESKDAEKFGDPSGRSYIQEIVEHDPTVKIRTAINDHAYGYDAVRMLLEYDEKIDCAGLVCLDSCPEWWIEHKNLRYPNKTQYSGKDIPDKNCSDHTPDTTRYGSAWIRYSRSRKDMNTTTRSLLIQ